MNDYRTKFNPPTQSTIRLQLRRTSAPRLPEYFVRRTGMSHQWGSILKNPLGGVYVILWKIEFNCCITKNYKSHIPNHKQITISNDQNYSPR